MVKFCETKIAQSELVVVYKNFEKNYKTYRTTWSGDVDAFEPELDPVAVAAGVASATTAAAALGAATKASAKATTQVTAAAAAAAAEAEQQRILQHQSQQQRGLRPRQRISPTA